jgi:hypothetical protein
MIAMNGNNFNRPTIDISGLSSGNNRNGNAP